MTLNSDSILALAPDSGSAANGKKLATPAKWPSLNAPEGLLWGECQGSGKDPYLVGVDLNGYVSKCSCPSRKFPCKHALALLLLYAAQPEKFGTALPPESLQTWLKGREQRAENKEQKVEEAAKKEADPAAQAKRRAAREKKVTDGLAALDTFLKDLVRDGLAQASSRPYSDWDTQAARLVDAQASGAARQVRRIPELLGDPAALLTQLARLHLLCEAWTRRDTLSDTEQADLKTALGFPLNQAELLAESGIKGRWLVAGIVREDEDTLTTRRTWLTDGARDALLLDFAPMSRPLPAGLPLGAVVEAELCFAPSALPQRAVLKGEAAVRPVPSLVLRASAALDDVLAQHAEGLAQNPWLERSGPYLLSEVQLYPFEVGWRVVDRTGQRLPVLPSQPQLYELLAQSGGRPFDLWAEWDGAVLRIMGGEEGQ